MHTNVINFKNGSTIEALPNTPNVVRSEIKYMFSRKNSKPALSMIQFFEMYRGTELADEEKFEIWNLFYGGDCSD